MFKISTGVKISFGLFDVTAREDSKPDCPKAQPFGDPEQLKEQEGKLERYATCERNLFRLDGGCRPFPDEPESVYLGLWSSQQSGEDGCFSEPPVLTVSFSQVHTSIGLTLVFDGANGDYCDLLEVKWLDGQGNLLSERQFCPTKPQAVLENKVEGYQKLVITFRKTAKPCRYLKLSRLLYGMGMTLDGEQISAASLLEEVDPTSSAISVNTLNFSLHSDGHAFSMLNPQGMFSTLQKRQRMDVTALVDGDELPMGGFYLESWESDGKNKVNFSATDPVGLLDKTRFDGGIFYAVPAGELVGSIFADAGVEYSIAEELAEIPLSGYLPVCTHREALQQAAFALGAVVDCSRTDRVMLYPLPERPSALIDYGRKFDRQTLKLRPEVTAVEAISHRYTPCEQQQNLLREVLEPGSYRVEFGRPMHSLTVTGATLAEAAVNFALLEVSEAGEVVLDGKEYQQTDRKKTARLANIPANLPPNVLTVEKATLLDDSRAEAVAHQLLDLSQLRTQNVITVRMGSERVGDRLVVQSERGEYLRGIVERMEIDLTGGCLATMTLAGIRIPTLAGSYAGELWAGDRVGVL